jgi:hypothetical protein
MIGWSTVGTPIRQPEAAMINPYALADKAGAILLQKVEQRLEALLAEHGASDPGELSRALQSQLLRSAILETAAANFPAANLEMLKHGFRSFTHSAFIAAMDRMRLACKSPGDAFAMTRGIHAAVVLAGYGLPVAPFDLEAMRIVAKPSNDIDTVLALFSADKGAYVGYSICEAPFYLLLTDLRPQSAAARAGPPETLRSQGAVRPHRQAPAIGSRAKLHAWNGRYRPPTGRHHFDCRIV